ncbi:Beta-glucosidase 24 [Apostasia shenzhenica]|uniref:Beta-glucosidase 24 n=1 Tax=Apostasia shenzhenica TaxID=1088818 RepID=A0A2I0AF18_9ASPA|nr:Beta-glucosidase 24 [Apostasia shenzhenica]
MALLPLATLPISGTKMEKMASLISPRVRRPLGGRAAAAVRCSAAGRTLGDAHGGFPPDFRFGAASSAYQVEGATTEGGRGPSIWDTFCHSYPEKIADRSSGEPGAGSYYSYKEDVKRLAELGVNAYRFSISWSRILPEGRGTPNAVGIQYYKNLIQELLDHQIEPFVTIFHWDMPQKLEDEYGGFLNERIVLDYKQFAKICFDNFGDKVQNWITLNEPLSFCLGGYTLGMHAPGRCTPNLEYGGVDFECPAGNSIQEPYTVAHNLLLAHAEAVQLYREEYQPTQGGKIGITMLADWLVPYDNSPQNIEAQRRGNDFNIGWFMDPIKFGDYPFSMKSLVRERLPIFKPEESVKLKDSFDFIGINYYTSSYAKDQGFTMDFTPKVYSDDARINTLVDKNGIPIGYSENNSWVYVYPRGIRDLLLHVKERYSDPDIYITENGVLQNAPGDPSPHLPKSLEDEMNDMYRAQYQSSHLNELAEAISRGVKVKGYFVWSLLDSFEWNFGYTSKFGLHFVNNARQVLEDDYMARIPKQSARWYQWFLSMAKAPQLLKLEGEEKTLVSPIPLGRATPIKKKKTTTDSSTIPAESKTNVVST